jgi:hypothetical protein
MSFDEFVRNVDAAIVAHTAGLQRAEPQPAEASWTARTRNATVALVEPRNVSVTLAGPAGSKATTTWYPIDSALVPVVANRIAGYLSEA